MSFYGDEQRTLQAEFETGDLAAAFEATIITEALNADQQAFISSRDHFFLWSVDADGWLYTGDAAIMDEDGYFYIKDRVKDMIISGGENVYPAEVENAIFGHPQVNEVAVIGIPDAKWGEAVKAVVSPKPGVEEIDAESVIAWARERIAGFKVPKSVDVIAELPRNASGKILRRELRAPYWEGYDRQVN